ncbi:MAG: LacI family DNA-binding transcriptional regulator [Bacillota bacterium]
MNPTIKDVALKANVSVATVSRVLNDLPGYSEDTRQLVLKVIKELGYQPNALARGLISQKSHTVGILIPNLSSMVASEILKGLEESAHKNNQSVIVCNTDNDGKRTLEYLQMLQEKRVEGIIIVSASITKQYYQKMIAMKIPVVLVCTVYPEIPSIKVNDEQAAYDATAYLIKKGHRRIGMINGTRSDQLSSTPRAQGYKKALADNGLPFRENYLVYGDFSFQSGISCFEQLLQTAPEITAIFAASDEMAAGILSGAHKHRIAIPDQLSVIGYDNTLIAEMSIPPLTTVSQPFHQMGRDGMNMLLDMIEHGHRKRNNIFPPHTIVERESVKAFNS